MTMDKWINDARFQRPGMLASLTLLFLFVIFVYGALLVGIMGIANWIIHAWNLTFFLDLGFYGVGLMVLCLLATWFVIVFSIAALPYYFLRAQGRYKRASQLAQIIIFLLFNIFTLPFILWPMVRNASPKLRTKRHAKLRQMVKNRKMVSSQDLHH